MSSPAARPAGRGKLPNPARALACTATSKALAVASFAVNPSHVRRRSHPLFLRRFRVNRRAATQPQRIDMRPDTFARVGLVLSAQSNMGGALLDVRANH